MSTIATLEVLFKSNADSFVGAIEGVANTLADVAVESVKTALRLNDMEQGFRAMSESGDQARETIAAIRDIAEGTDFGFQDLEKAGVRLLQLKTPGDQVVETVEAIANAIDSVEGTTAQIDQVVNAIGRIHASGEITKRTLTQIGMAGVDASEILRKEFGITGDVVEGLREKHISASEATAALLRGMMEMTKSGITEQGDILNTEIKNLQDNMTKLFETIGKELIPFVTPVVEYLNKTLKEFSDLIRQDFADLKAFLQVAQYLPGVGGLAATALDAISKGEGIARASESFAGAKAGTGGTGGGAGGGNVVRAAEEVTQSFTRVATSGTKVHESFERLEFISVDTAKALKTLAGIAGEKAFEGAKAAAESIDEYGNVLDEATIDMEEMSSEVDEIVESFAFANEGLDELQSGVVNTAGGMDRLRQLALEPMMNQVFKTEQTFASLDDGIKKLSNSIIVNKDSIDTMFPKLKGAGDLFDQMSKQILQVTVGEGGGMLAAYHSIIAQNESSLRLLAFMEATGQGVQAAGTQFDELAAKMPGMSTAFDDLLASFQHNTVAAAANAEALQTVADTTLVSVSAGMAGAQAAASAVNTGLAQLGAGLGVYGQMAATGQLPGGLPGGNPFSQTGNPLGYGGTEHTPGPGSITNPFAPGTPWGGGQHGFAPGGSGNWGGGPIVITLQSNDGLIAQAFNTANARWMGQNSRGVRGK